MNTPSLYFTESRVAQLLSMDVALAAVEAAHLAHGQGQALDTPRQRTRLPNAALHILQGALPQLGVFGFKAYTTARALARFRVYLFNAADATLLAEFEANTLGMMRTGAAGGIAAKYLARPDAKIVGLFGCGWQAQSQIEALCRVRPIERIKVFSRNAEKRSAFCAAQTLKLGIEVVAANSAEETVRDSDIIVTITSANTPLFDGAWLKSGAHINAAGANALIRREIDEVSVARANVVCVDSRKTARLEAGDLLPSLEKGRLTEMQWVELGELVAGSRPGRVTPEQITLFESQGMAIQDLAVAAKLLEIANTVT